MTQKEQLEFIKLKRNITSVTYDIRFKKKHCFKLNIKEQLINLWVDYIDWFNFKFNNDEGKS
jgi:hypothetical protein